MCIYNGKVLVGKKDVTGVLSMELLVCYCLARAKERLWLQLGIAIYLAECWQSNRLESFSGDSFGIPNGRIHA